MPDAAEKGVFILGIAERLLHDAQRDDEIHIALEPIVDARADDGH